VSLIHGTLTTFPPIAVASPAMPSTKLAAARLGYAASAASSRGRSAPVSAYVRSLDRPTWRTSGPSPDATAVVTFWSIESHGIATALTAMPVSLTNGSTSFSNFAELSPITHTVSEAGVPADEVPEPSLGSAAVPPEEQAASVRAESRPTGASTRRRKEFAIEDPFRGSRSASHQGLGPAASSPATPGGFLHALD
jgi:hypothetical protein